MFNIKEIAQKAFIAGLCIAIGGTVFLKVGGVAGAILFSFGLLSVVCYGLKLYTGTAGFINLKNLNDWKALILILLFNIIGCFFTALLVSTAAPDLVDVAHSIVEKRMAAGALNDGIMALFCGFIMTTAVNFGRKGQFLPLLFGVPLFILSGFTHSIADAFYFLMDYKEVFNSEMLIIYLMEVIGNFVGCNLYRFVVREG